MNFFRQLTTVSLLLLTFTNGIAQRWAYWQDQPGVWMVGVESGTTRYAGDLGEDKDLFRYPRLGAIVGLSTSYRLTNRVSARADARMYYIWGSHRHTRVYYNNLSFFSINPDIWAGAQLNLWSVNDPNHWYNPYLLVGGGLTYLNTYAHYSGHTVSLPPLQTEGVAYSRLPGIIRYGIGLPLRITGIRSRLNLEFTYTHVLNDYLDDVSTTYPDFFRMSWLAVALSDRRSEIGLPANSPGNQRGNPTKHDGYAALSLRWTYQLNSQSWNRYRRGIQTPRVR